MKSQPPEIAIAILDSVADGVTVQNAEGRLIYANDAAARMSGLSSGEEMVRTPPSEILTRYELLDELGRPIDASKLPGRIALLERRESEAVVGWRDKRTASVRWSIVRAAPLLDPTGELRASVNIFRDITETRRAEEARRFVHEEAQELMRSLSVGVILTRLARALASRAADHCLVYLLNGRRELERAAEASLDPDDEAILRELRQFTVDAGPHSPPWRAIETKTSVLAEDIDPDALTAMARTTGWLAAVRKLDVHSTLTVPILARGEAIGAVGLVLSDPDRSFSLADRALAEALADRAGMAVLNARLYASEQEARRQAEDVAKAREQLLAVVSHDLRTPLAAMGMAANMLEAVVAEDSVEGQKALSILQRASQSMYRLISDLLDLARIDAGTLRVERAPQDFEAVLHECMELLSPIAGEKGQRLALDGGCGGAVVECDRDRIVQVMSNLVGNALKFTPPGGAVTVRVAALDGCVEVRVHDEGPGIDPVEIDRVFERYWQSGSAGDEGGIGLGLSIAKGIVEAHGGGIEVSSEPGRGSVFAFRLPR